MDTSTSNMADNPFAGPKAPVPGKVLVQMPTEDWLCRKLSKLNVILGEDYPSHMSEASGLDERSVPETCKVTIQVVWAVF